MNASRAELATRFSPDSLIAPRRLIRHVQGRQHGPVFGSAVKHPHDLVSAIAG
jgi:hypothetical protein